MPHVSARARGDARPDSDIDILVEIAPEIRMDVFRYVGIVHSIEDLFPMRVDFYRHQYDNVAASYVWETVTVHLPPLLAAVVAEIKASEGEI